MSLNSYILFWICILGLCLGSFFNVVILRSLSNESIVFPPSKCPKCGHRLYAWHNIPVISYVLLRGKCYFCKEKISIQYPIVELLTMVLFALTYMKFELSLKTVFSLILISCLIIMTTTDVKEKIVDCNIAVIIAASGIIYNIITYGWNGLWASLSGLIAGAVIIEIIARIGYLFAKTRAMGEADTYVAGALGAFFTIKGIIPVLICSFAVSMFFILPVYIYKRFKNKDYYTCISFILFFISLLIFEAAVQNIFTFIFLIFAGCVLIYYVIKSMHTPEKLNYFPFVPALAVGALIGLQFLF